MPVAEYIAKFEEFKLRCDIREDRRMTISRFRSGLRPELQRELVPHTVNTLERVFQMVQELEKYLKSSNVVKQTDSQRSDFHVGTFATPSSTTNLVKIAKGKGVLVDTRGGGTQRCYRCQGFGHFAVQCPTKEAIRNLCAHINEQADNQGEFEEDIYEPQQPDADCGIDFEPLQPKLVNQSIPNKEEQDKVGKTEALHIITLKERKEDAEVPSQVEVKPDSHGTHITKEDLPHIDPKVLECYYSFISLES
ncbi:hypothetical protein Pyn_00898 [Prunus yedoensis var. nudiflora]|uniref:CCHC-type domain-containing protein n=1 Tax=Prunus yedoensis var. nudiflora TaxID=2094558 RepID=A0A314ZC39_PRUYE|nr:hypothetical protein Pyn_00898 [Prunus yedoensis var. nudiflora]